MKFLKDKRGMVMLEAAITTPIAILVMLAIVNLGAVVCQRNLKSEPITL